MREQAIDVERWSWDELAEGYLACLHPTGAEDAAGPGAGWRFLAAVGSCSGLAVGLLGYLVLGAYGTPGPASKPVLAEQLSKAALAAVEEEEAQDAELGDELPLARIVPPQHRASLDADRTRMSASYRRMLRKGWLRYRAREYRAASIAFGRAVHLDPKRISGYYGLSLSLFEQGLEDAALRTLERGADKVGRKSDLWVLAGSIYQWRGNERLARSAYQRYLDAEPHGAYARDVRFLLSQPRLPELVMD
ncbi:MAG: hypothetical protein JXR96_18165 [Deltaproteobacteria bacterium]|nr:hypothetical protein [Deltaproteobacteria bacterium]